MLILLSCHVEFDNPAFFYYRIILLRFFSLGMLMASLVAMITCEPRSTCNVPMEECIPLKVTCMLLHARYAFVLNIDL